jgi:hypothetical protein
MSNRTIVVSISILAITALVAGLSALPPQSPSGACYELRDVIIAQKILALPGLEQDIRHERARFMFIRQATCAAVHNSGAAPVDTKYTGDLFVNTNFLPILQESRLSDRNPNQVMAAIADNLWPRVPRRTKQGELYATAY